MYASAKPVVTLMYISLFTVEFSTNPLHPSTTGGRLDAFQGWHLSACNEELDDDEDGADRRRILGGL